MQETKTNNKTNKSRGKDYIAAGTVGFVTAFFANIIFINADIPLVFQGVTFPYWTFYIFFPLVESAGYFVAARIFARILILKQAGRFGIVGLMNFTVDTRSEEHTSELQSQSKLLSRLFFFNDTATTEIYTLSLHDALPISHLCAYFNFKTGRTVRDCRPYELYR